MKAQGTGGKQGGSPEPPGRPEAMQRPGTGEGARAPEGAVCPGEELRFSYPPLLKHGWEITIVGLLGLLGIWWLTVDITDTAWSDPDNLALLAFFVALAVVGQLQRSSFAIRQPSCFVFRGDVLEVRWRRRVARYRPEEVSVGEVEVVPLGAYKGVRVTTPDGAFYVTERLRRFGRFVELLHDWSRGEGGVERKADRA